MAGFTNTTETAVLDHIFGKTAYTQPTHLYVGLSTTTPIEAGTNFTEPSSGAYARVDTEPTDWNAAVSGDPAITDNASVITFPTATASWGTVTHFGIYSASTGGTLILWGALTANKTIDTDDTPQFAIGALDVKLGDANDV